MPQQSQVVGDRVREARLDELLGTRGPTGLPRRAVRLEELNSRVREIVLNTVPSLPTSPGGSLSGGFALDDGTATTSGDFAFDDGAP